MDVPGPFGSGDGNDRSGRTLPVTASTQPAPAGAPRRPDKAASRWRRWAWRSVLVGLALVGTILGQIVVYRFAMPAWTPTMAVSWLVGEPVVQRWVPLERVSRDLVRAVVVSEDARFCVHHGIDLGELKAAIEEARNGVAPRGASTISMQVVKNLFLWPGRSYVRKAVELPLALVLDFVWPKRRVLEVYLNIAEWGPGIYGIEAASRNAFGKSASALTAAEAVRLAVVLPNPVERDPADLEPRIERVSRVVAARLRGGVNTGCLD